LRELRGRGYDGAHDSVHRFVSSDCDKNLPLASNHERHILEMK
jgi:hypothetical protein